MNTPSAKLLVLVGEQFACVKIVGRANFNSSIDFKTLIHELRDRGYQYFVLDLAECVLMDSTFLGVLAGFGLRMNVLPNDSPQHRIELLNASPRIVELLENLGVLHLFKLGQGCRVQPGVLENSTPVVPGNPTREEITLACLEAHQTLMALNPDNVARFKDVAQFLAEDLRKLKAGA